MEIFQITNFWNFPNWKFFFWKFSEFSKMIIFGIFKSEFFAIFWIGNFSNYPNQKIYKFLEFFQFRKPKFGSKISNYGIVRPFDIPQYSQFCYFSKLKLNLEIEIEQCQKFHYFRNWRIWEILGIFQIKIFRKLEILRIPNFWNFLNCIFLKFFELQILGIFQTLFRNFSNTFSEFSKLTI